MNMELKNMERRIFGNELKYVQEVLETDFTASKGSLMTQRLENSFAACFGVKYAISHINGTATLHALLEAVGVKQGDEVIVPPLTMSSTSMAVLQANATPIFADVNPLTYLIDPQAIEKCITKQTKAIITVSLYGLSPDMAEIMKIAKRHNLFVIEDNAQCFLGTYRGEWVGTMGHAASYSFQNSKHMTSGEGGMVTTNDPLIAEKVRRVSSLGYAGVGANKAKITKKDIQDPDYARHLIMGWNYRMPELCAAVALAQLENLQHFVQKRVHAAQLFADVVESCDWLIPQLVPEDCGHAYWSFVVKLNHPEIGWRNFTDVFAQFGGDGIYSAWQLTYLEPMFVQMTLLNRESFISKDNQQRYRRGLCPIAESLQPNLLQFKTNYWQREEAVRQAHILKQTIEYLNRS